MQSGQLNFDVSVKSLAYTSASSLEEFLAFEIDDSQRYGVRLQEVRIDADAQLFFNSYPDTLYFVLLVTVDDPDTLAVLPIVARIAASSPRFGLRILRDDADLSLMNMLVDEVDFLEDLDDLDLPQLYVFDEEWQLQEQWGPRPQEAEAYLESWLEQHPEYEALDDDSEAYGAVVTALNNEMRLWYNSGLTQACVAEIWQLLAGLQSDNDSDETNDD